MGKTVIFDFDGTLADTVDLVLKIYNELAPKLHSLPISRDEFPALRKLGYRQIIKKKRLSWFRLPWLLRAVPKRMQQSVDEVKAYPGMTNLVESLLKSGYQVGVLSSNRVEFLNDFFANNNFPKLSFVISEKSLFGKDKALKKIMQSQGLNSKEVVYVGDEPRDVEASRKAGIQVIGVSWGLAGHDGFASAPPDKIVDSADQLESVIKQVLS